jgi:hypothetical protein
VGMRTARITNVLYCQILTSLLAFCLHADCHESAKSAPSTASGVLCEPRLVRLLREQASTSG